MAELEFPSGFIGPSEDIIAIAFPLQHDAHVQTWRWIKFCQSNYGFTPDFTKALRAAEKFMNEARR